MDRTIKLKFSLGDRVRIKELDVEGKVVSIWIVPRGISYEIRYFHNGDAKTIYFYEEELEDARARY